MIANDRYSGPEVFVHLRHRLSPLSVGEIHVLQANLDVAEPIEEALHGLLSRDEGVRASEFAVAIHKRRFVAARGLLRLLLSAYLEQEPGDLEFRYGVQGKPELSARAGAGNLGFNVSHSDGVVLYGIARDHALGIDVEHVKDLEQMEDVAELFFSRQEFKAWRSFPAEARTKAFFRCWTRKEAFIKALGGGVSYPLDRFDVTLGERAELLSLEGDRTKAAEWTLYNCDLSDGVAGAVAVRGRGLKLAPFALNAAMHPGSPGDIQVTASPLDLAATGAEKD